MEIFRRRALLSLLSPVVAGLGSQSLEKTSTVAAWNPDSSAVLLTQNAAKVAVAEHLKARNTLEEDHNLGLDNTTQSNLAEAHTLTGRISDGSGNGSYQMKALGERIPISNTNIALYVTDPGTPLDPIFTLATFVVALDDIFGQNPHAPMLKEYVWSYEFQAFITLRDADQSPRADPHQPHTYGDIATALAGLARYMTASSNFLDLSFTVWRTIGEAVQGLDAYLVARGSVGHSPMNTERNQSTVSAPDISPAATDAVLKPTTMATAFMRH